MKQKLRKNRQFLQTGVFGGANLLGQKGFSLLELIVVLTVMGILSTILIANFAGQRVNQRLRIAQNEMVTNLRKLQSFTLSSRDLPSGETVQYYLLKIDTANPRQYTVQAMYDVASSPKIANVETIFLPGGIKFASTSPVTIERDAVPTSAPPSGGYPCSLVAFKLPFAKTLISYGSASGCVEDSWNPNTDDYQKILNFVTNTANYPVSQDSKMVIKFSDEDDKKFKSVTIEGLSGVITFD